MKELYELNLKKLWEIFWGEHPAFWSICLYLFFEYVRPQSIYPALNFLPWAQLFLAASLVFAIADRSVKWVRSPINKWMILFGAFIWMSSMFAEFPEVSKKHLIDFFSWFMVYFLIINIVNTNKRHFIFLLIFFVATFKISLSLTRQWAGRRFAFDDWGLMGPPGYFENSGELSIQMLMFLPPSYYLLLTLRPWLSSLKSFVLLLMPMTAAMTIMGASSRGSQLGLIIQIYLLFLRKRLTFKNIMIVIAALSLIYALIPAEQKHRLSTSGKDKTSEKRLLYWRHGFEMIQDHPLLGVGYFNFPPYHDRHYPQASGEKAELPHNIFVQVGTDVGVIGLSIYWILLYKSFRTGAEIRKRCKDLKENSTFYTNMSYGFDAALIGFVVAGQFVTVTYYPFFWVNLSFTVALKNILDKEIELQKKDNKLPQSG